MRPSHSECMRKRLVLPVQCTLMMRGPCIASPMSGLRYMHRNRVTFILDVNTPLIKYYSIDHYKHTFFQLLGSTPHLDYRILLPIGHGQVVQPIDESMNAAGWLEF